MMEQSIEKAYHLAVQRLQEGKVATYIPELAKMDPSLFGACVKTKDGQTYCCGDWKREFTMQSIVKTIILLYALQKAGPQKVFSVVGVEPAGEAFNSIAKLETKSSIPLNPMINAGAIAVASCCMQGDAAEQVFADFLALVQKLCGRPSVCVNETVYLSEQCAGARNRSMAYLLHSENILQCAPEEAVNLYFKMCSISVTAEDLSHYALVLANGGTCPVSGEQLIPGDLVRITKTLMFTCGLYDGSGEFAVRVGFPGKSGVGGGIIGVVENAMGIATFGPALDEKGNSVGGMIFLEHLSKELGLHCFSGNLHHQNRNLPL